MTNKKEISLLKKVVKNLDKPLIAGSVFPEQYIRDEHFQESFNEICDKFDSLIGHKHETDEELFVIERNALLDKLDKFFETYPEIAYIQKSWASQEKMLSIPFWVREHFRTSILEATIWFEILRLTELIAPDLEEEEES